MSPVQEVIVDGKLVGTKEEITERAIANKKVRSKVVDTLAVEDRSQRIMAARVVNAIAIEDPSLIKEYPDELADALERPEAQTRWEILGALEKVVDADARVVDRAFDGTTAALHDEDSGVVRLAAFRLLATYGATTETRSEKVWPLLDEAIRIYHGDSEFPQMLTGLIRLVSGNASDNVREAAAETMSFDAEHSKGLTGRRAKQVVSCRPKKRRKKKQPKKES
jgi:HEAT repeat protein